MLEGKIHLTPKYVLLTSKLNYSAYAMLLLIICIFSFSYFVLGGLVMNVLMVLVHFFWERKSRGSTKA